MSLVALSTSTSSEKKKSSPSSASTNMTALSPTADEYHPYSHDAAAADSPASDHHHHQQNQHEHQKQQQHEHENEHPNREIALFWDYENLALPGWIHPADASKLIVEAVTGRLKKGGGSGSHGGGGRIVDRRLYFDFSRDGSGGMFSALDSTGFDLVNTPRRNGKKETLDKKLIADVLTFAWDSAVRNGNRKPCIVLLTSDGDYAYTLSKLRDRGVSSVVVHGNDSSVAKVLKSSADVLLDFEDDILRKFGDAKNNNNNAPADYSKSSPVAAASAAARKDGRSISPTSTLTASSTAGCSDSSSSSLPSPSSKAAGTTTAGFSKFDSPFKSDTSNYLFIKNVSVSVTIQDLVVYLESFSADVGEELVVEEGFLAVPQVPTFSAKPSFVFAEIRMRDIKHAVTLYNLSKRPGGMSALANRQISIDYNLRPVIKYKGNPALYYDRRQHKSENSSSAAVASAATAFAQTPNLFVKNVPASTTLEQLVRFFENQQDSPSSSSSSSLKVVRATAKMTTSKFRPGTKNARIEMADGLQASALLKLNNSILLDGNHLEIVANLHWPIEKESGNFLHSSSTVEYYESSSLTTGGGGGGGGVASRSTTSAAAATSISDGDVSTLCRAIEYLERTSPNGWIDCGGVAGSFYEMMATRYRNGFSKAPVALDKKERFQLARERACEQGLIEHGRRRLSTGWIVVAPVKMSAAERKVYSPNNFFRLTRKSRVDVGDSRSLCVARQSIVDDKEDEISGGSRNVKGGPEALPPSGGDSDLLGLDELFTGNQDSGTPSSHRYDTLDHLQGWTGGEGDDAHASEEPHVALAPPVDLLDLLDQQVEQKADTELGQEA